MRFSFVENNFIGRLYLGLYHGRTLCEEHLDRLEHVDDSLVPHPLQDNTQRHEHTRTTHASATTKRSNRAILQTRLGPHRKTRIIIIIIIINFNVTSDKTQMKLQY